VHALIAAKQIHVVSGHFMCFNRLMGVSGRKTVNKERNVPSAENEKRERKRRDFELNFGFKKLRYLISLLAIPFEKKKQ